MGVKEILAAMTPTPRAKKDRSFGYNLADNFIGIDDGVQTPGERLGSGLNVFGQAIASDPVGTMGDVIGGVKGDLDNLMFEGGAMQRPQDVLGYAAAPMAPGALSGALMRNVPNQVNAVPLRGGGMSDPTQTGWTFKDVDGNIGLSRSEERRLSEGAIAPTEQVLPIRSMYAMQDRVNPDFATTETSAGMLPNAVRKNGKIFLQDGHHRVTKVAEEGGQNVRVNFFDFDRPDMSTPLLDYDEKKAKREKQQMEALFREMDELFGEEELSAYLK